MPTPLSRFWRLLLIPSLALVTTLVACGTRPAPSLAAGATYYVSSGGSDSSGNGSEANPWATPQKAADAMSGGDIVRISAGRYPAFTIRKSGTSAAYTKFIGEAGTIISGGTDGITISASWVWLEGLQVTGHSANGIYAANRSHLRVRSCEVASDVGNAPDEYAGVTFRNGSDILVDGSSVHNLNAGGIHFLDCSAATAAGNSVTDLLEDGLCVYGTNITVDGNTVLRCNSQSNHGDGIVVQAPWSKVYGADTAGVVIRNNLVSDCSQYIYLDSWGQSGCDIDGVLIYNNVLYAPVTTQYQTGMPFDAERGQVRNVAVYNNTFASFANAGSGGSAALRWVTRSASYSNFTLRNNLYLNSRVERDRSPSISNMSMDHDLYYSPGKTIIKWNGTGYSTLAAFASAQTGQETHGVQGNPLLDSGYRLQQGSAALDAGVGPLADGRVPVTDAAGTPRTGPKSSIGAYEYGGPSASLVLTSGAAKVMPGQTVLLTGRLTLDGTVLSDRRVTVYKKEGSASWRADIIAPYVEASGAYMVARTPTRRTLYAMYFEGDAGAGLRPSQSNNVPVGVFTLARDVTLSRKSMSKGAKVKVTTRVSGPEPCTVKFRSYRLIRGKWRFYRSYAPTARKWGFPARRYSAAVKLPKRGYWRFRVWIRDENGTAWGPMSARVRVR